MCAHSKAGQEHTLDTADFVRDVAYGAFRPFTLSLNWTEDGLKTENSFSTVPCSQLHSNRESPKQASRY